ncbi:MAG TPA: TadE family protein [Candidatus Limnocylindrales bacterium]|nr:TadE family protein [Candidatus Limnocylindrales bacterium]
MERRNRKSRGQALVEFSLVLIPFMWMLLGVVDLGRGIYINNGVAEAAREIARADSVHACDSSPCSLGTSTETTDAINTQKALIPGLGGAGSSITFTCTDVSDTVVANCGSDSGADYYVRVTVTVPFSVLTPLLSMVAPTTLTSTSHIQLVH